MKQNNNVICTSCGKQLAEGENFCTNCGNKVIIKNVDRLFDLPKPTNYKKKLLVDNIAGIIFFIIGIIFLLAVADAELFLSAKMGSKPDLLCNTVFCMISLPFFVIAINFLKRENTNTTNYILIVIGGIIGYVFGLQTIEEGRVVIAILCGLTFAGIALGAIMGVIVELIIGKSSET